MTQYVPALGQRWKIPFFTGRAPAPLMALAWRYGLSIAGPVAVSGAHFLASLLFLRELPAAEFGIFSFVLVVSAFAMSLTGAGLVLPATHSILKGDDDVTAACFKLALTSIAIGAFALTGAVMAGGVGPAQAAPLGLYGAVMAYRWFARSLAYVEGRIAPAIQSDLAYSIVVVAGLVLMALTNSVSLLHGGECLLLAAAISLVPFRGALFRTQIAALRKGRLGAYVPSWRDVTGWSLLGVALTEITLNAHAYLVTFIAGPGAFALPALGMLLMRPVSLVQNALPDLERPAMMRAIAARDGARLDRILRQFQGALALVLLATALAAAALLIWAPHLLLRDRYPLQQAVLAALLSAAIMTARTLRTPLSVLLQSAGEFKALARLGGASAAVSLAATLTLLLTFGAVASLGGILAGDIVILAAIRPLARKARIAGAKARIAHD